MTTEGGPFHTILCIADNAECPTDCPALLATADIVPLGQGDDREPADLLDLLEEVSW